MAAFEIHDRNRRGRRALDSYSYVSSRGREQGADFEGACEIVGKREYLSRGD